MRKGGKSRLGVGKNATVVVVNIQPSISVKHLVSYCEQFGEVTNVVFSCSRAHGPPNSETLDTFAADLTDWICIIACAVRKGGHARITFADQGSVEQVKAEHMRLVGGAGATGGFANGMGWDLKWDFDDQRTWSTTSANGDSRISGTKAARGSD